MVMQKIHSPKPKIFGVGYGKHLSYNYGLMKKFFWLGWKMLVNMFIPAAFYERAHWEVIELYHKMRGYRHGTFSDHRCPNCGADFPSTDECHDRRDELKELENELERTRRFDRDMIEEEYRQYLESLITPECEERIRQIESGEVKGIDWRSLEDSKT